jgi:hypothetical protein
VDPMDRIRELLGRITDLSDQELSELRDLVLQVFQETDSGAGDVPDDATMGLLSELANITQAVRSEIGTRNAARRDRANISAELAAGIESLADSTPAETPVPEQAAAPETEAAPAEDADAEDTNKDKDKVAVTAAANNGPTGVSLHIEPPADRRPKPVETRATVVASADVPGVPMGTAFADELDVAGAMVRRIDSLRHANGGDGEQVVVASIRTEWPDDRHLKNADPEANYRKVVAVTKPTAIVAAGGMCAPVEARYDLFGTGVTDRPVKESLASFQADRGGIRFITPPTLAQLNGAVGVWTVQNDVDAALPSNPGATPPFVSPTKPVLRVACGAEVVVNTQAVTVGLVFGNMQSRAYPELVARHTDLAMVAHARVAEQQLLAQIGALSLKVTTGTQVVGAARHLLSWVDRALAGYRNRYRTGPLPIRLIFPLWFKDELRADIVQQLPGDGMEVFALADTLIEAWFRARGCNVTWALDGEAGQDFAAQPDNAAISGFPANVIWYLFVEGTFLFLDGGQLDLGIVRDSSLNAKNDYQTFVETFEAVAKIGHEGLRVSSAIRPTGATSAAVAVP